MEKLKKTADLNLPLAGKGIAYGQTFVFPSPDFRGGWPEGSGGVKDYQQRKNMLDTLKSQINSFQLESFLPHPTASRPPSPQKWGEGKRASRKAGYFTCDSPPHKGEVKNRVNKPQTTLLSDGKRLHLSHGPIELLIEAWGEKEQITQAYRQATTRFQTILTELVDELPLLRTPVTENSPIPIGLIAQAMHAAVTPHAPRFITPMAAVAGSVADEILVAMLSNTNLDKAYVNNGGDIALHLNDNTRFRAGIIANPASGVTKATISHKSPIRGIATSGHHGRSHSFGIADAVTVFARTAAIADAAATIIANDVNLADCRQIIRQPANGLSPDSDLGPRLVTVKVPPLSASNIVQALNNGEKTAHTLYQNGLIEAAFLSLQGEERLVGRSIDPQNQQHRIAYA